MDVLLSVLFAQRLRIGEAIRLQAEDVDLTNGVLTVRGSKFGKSRLVPIHPSTQVVLDQYRVRRERVLAGGVEATLFITRSGHSLNIGDIRLNG
jgi:integrase/recombinase XerD